MNQDWQNRLRRLGVIRGARELKPAERKRPFPTPPTTKEMGEEGGSLEKLFPGGRLQETAVGACFVLDSVYPLSHQHGRRPLSALLEFSPQAAALFCQDERLAGLDFHDFLFLDTETTGLAGAGVLPFMVGVAFFERGRGSEAFVVRQYFLRDHGDEAAMLSLLGDLLEEKAGLVTFNGRTFDLPLLETRYLMNRMLTHLRDAPHIDLLPPARRLWRNRLGSVALGALEQNLLGIERTQEDVPGWLIPSLYHDYLRSGDARDMQRVFYHNRIDMLSMVSLIRRIMRQFLHATPDDHPLDLYSVGRWQAELGLTAEAERNLRRAVAGDLSLEMYHQALRRLGLLLKQNGRRAEALPVWQQWAATSLESVEAHVELAKYYEWQARDWETAVFWTEQALRLVNSWRESERARLLEAELQHRLARLRRKQSSP